MGIKRHYEELSDEVIHWESGLPRLWLAVTEK